MDKSGQKGPKTYKRKLRRSRPDSLGALSSLVSFDDQEAGDSKHEQGAELSNDNPLVSKTTKSIREDDHAFTRVLSAPYPPSTLVARGVPSLRKTLSQDWLKTSFSPRPGREPRKDLLLGSACVRPQRQLSNMPSLRSIPEESELDRDEGSELSDDNAIPEAVPRPTSSSGKAVVETRPDTEESASGSDECSSSQTSRF